MKHTEEEIITKGKEILKDLYGSSYREEEIQKAMFDPEQEPLRGSSDSAAIWTVVIEPVSGSLTFLSISDETGEPLYIQSKHLVCEIKKDTYDKYMRVD